MIQKLLLILLIIASLLVTQPVTAQHANCAHQVFAGTELRYTRNYGVTYQLVSPSAATTLRSVYACPITSAVTLGQYQALGFMADQLTMVVWSSPDGQTYYVHREWRIYALTAAQWGSIATSVMFMAKAGR